MKRELQDVAVVAKQIRTEIAGNKDCIFSVKINRQWENAKDEPRSIIYVKGGYSIPTNTDVERKAEARSHVGEIINRIATEQGFRVLVNPMFDSFTLIRQLKTDTDIEDTDLPF